MNYNYLIEKDGIQENFDGKILFWSWHDFKKQNSTMAGMWYNRKYTLKVRQSSFLRTKEWLLQNHPELIL
jgi:hypothetical protein